MLEERFFLLQKKIQKACDKAGRSPNDIKILLATKSQEVSTLQSCISLGYDYFGENRLDELQSKQAQIKKAKWDFIGHLQSKKTKDVIGKVGLIHSVDRNKLVDEINKRAKLNNIKQDILIEVNTSREETKSGVLPEDFSQLVEHAVAKSNLTIKGLMTIAKNSNDETLIRPCFQTLYSLRQDLSKKIGQREDQLELSMGMSNDFTLAIEEGASIIRIGSFLFGARS